ncbi:MAG: Fic family protein [Oscillospiraceae bacterium]|nr:Fic family protein [Oscillospiraceae bacterium]
MRNYNYETIYTKLLTPEIVQLLAQIHEHKGEHARVQEDELTHLIEIARIQSTEASNRIEGIYTSDERLQKLVKAKTTPRNRSEKEIAGYRDVLATIHSSHEYIPVKPGMILQLHRDLYKFSGMSFGGSYKTADNVISEEDSQGNKHIRFHPVPAWETPEAMERLCRAYNDLCNSGQYDPLLMIPVFILDFLCIHPFNDGNGRMSRLLTLLLLYRAGYHVGKYVSIEQLIERTKDAYYDCLQESSCDWHEEENDYIPFVTYQLGVILAAYRQFSDRVKVVSESTRKPNRIREIIQGHPGKITKAEIMQHCPDISQTTIQRALNELVKSGEVIKIGGGRYTSYTWNREID